MKKNLILTTLLFSLQVVFSQNVALTTQITQAGDKILFEGKPFTGELYEYSETTKNECSCIMKALYVDGKRDGSYEEWYPTGKRKQKSNFSDGKLDGLYTSWHSNGNKEFSGGFVLNKKTGNHTLWNSDKTIKNEDIYDKNTLLEKKRYFNSGKLESHVRYHTESLHLIYQKVLFENGIVSEEVNYKNKKLHGAYIANFENGKPYKNITYDNGEEVEKTIYDDNGLLEETLLKKESSNLLEYRKFNNGNLIEQGDYSFQRQKENTWLVYDGNDNKLKETQYSSGKIMGHGSYQNDKKDGIWVQFHSDGITQTNTTYNLGAEINKQTFKSSHLYSSNFGKFDRVSLYEFIKETGDKEYIAITYDNPSTSSFDDKNKEIIREVKKVFEERMRILSNREIDESTILHKLIHINNLNVEYKKTDYVSKYDKNKITGYDAFIYFNLNMKDVDGKELFSKKYKINRSDKLLNTLLNNAGETYSRNESQAFSSALKGIKLKKFFKKYFPIDKKKK